MAKGKQSAVEMKTTLGERERHARPLTALVLMTLAVLVLAALLDHDVVNNPIVDSDFLRGQGEFEMNQVGVFGAYVSTYLFHFTGMAAWLLCLLLLRFSYLCLYKKAQFFKIPRVFMALGCLIAAMGLMAMLDAPTDGFEHDPVINPDSHYARYTAGTGGVIGHGLYQALMKDALGPFGSGLLYMMIALSLAVPVLIAEPKKFFSALSQYYSDWFARKMESHRKSSAERQERRALEREERKQLKEAAALEREEQKAKEVAEKEAEAKMREEIERKVREEAEKELEKVKEPEVIKEVEEPAPKKVAKKAVVKEVVLEPIPEAPKKVEAASVEDILGKSPKDEEPTAKPIGALKIFEGEVVEKAQGHLPERKGKYVFPGLDLLTEAPPRAVTHENYEETATALVETLKQFKVDVILGEIHSGPVITRYEVVPAPGVRVNKIESLDKDLALGLKADSVRILAPVPGKGTVGIEVPNQKSEPVFLRDIIESKAWADSDAEIPIVLGKEVTGKPVVIDLTKMPHMLIAGSTGSGKSVCINALIASLLYKTSPDDLRFIMVDPKMVELKIYNDLPHMLVPVVTEPKKVPGALKYLIKEMELRFQIFSEVGVRNIAGFNAKILKDKAADEKADAMEAALSPEERIAVSNIEVPRDKGVMFEIPKEKLPYIVCIIDELADLMMVAPADIEHSIMRLTQLARAAGIHVILATQRPSVNVITGVIKSNIPTRIAFKVASNTDSRTILDGKGAEGLIGKGDMLFTPPGSMNVVRAQGAFVSDDEIAGIVDFVHDKNGDPIFDESVQRQIESEGEDAEGGDEGGDGKWDDPLVPQAIEVIRTGKRASTSMLQRRLKIGYNRAARIMEMLEDEGIVGPENGSSPREILMDVDL